MNKKTMAALVVSLGILCVAPFVAAQPVANNFNFCTKLSGSIAPGTVGPREQRVIHGPYTVKCGTTSHHFSVRGASGQVPVILQQFRGGNWSAVTGKTYDPSGSFGAGTFRLVIDNLQGQASVSYTGSYVVPM